MPVASSKEAQLTAAQFHHLIPKPPGYSASTQHGQRPASIQEGATFVSSELAHYSGATRSGSGSPYFNPQSPPILNLSPNLSPSELQRNSPVFTHNSGGYDLRESTRRRSIQGEKCPFALIKKLYWLCICSFGVSSSHNES